MIFIKSCLYSMDIYEAKLQIDSGEVKAHPADFHGRKQFWQPSAFLRAKMGIPILFPTILP